MDELEIPGGGKRLNTYIVEKGDGELVLAAAETPQAAARYRNGVSAHLVLDDYLRQTYCDYRAARCACDAESELAALTSLLEILDGLFIYTG